MRSAVFRVIRRGIFGLVLLLPLFSQADDTMQLYTAAVKAFKGGQYKTALLKFQVVNKRRPDPVLELNIGRCHEKLGDYRSALVHCKIALGHRNTSAATRRTAAKCVKNAEMRLAPAQLTIRSIPSLANISIDGKPVGKTPWTGDVPSGRRQLDFTLQGYRPFTRYTSVKQGQTYAVTGVLVPEKVGALLSVTSVPPASQVFLDGSLIGEAPIERHPVAARAYAIEVKREGFLPQAVTTTLSDGSHLEQTFNLVSLEGSRAARPVHWGAWTLTGTGGVLITTGVAFGLLALDANLTADRLARTSRQEQDRTTYQNALVDSRQHASVADGLFLGGTLLLTSGLTWMLWSDGE